MSSFPLYPIIIKVLLKINTPKGSCGSVEVVPNETTVQDLHDKVRELLNYTDTDYFVMVLAGKKLTDMESKLSQYKVKNNGVVIVAKMNNPPQQAKPPATSPTSAVSPSPAASTTPTPPPTSTSQPTTAASSSQPAPSIQLQQPTTPAPSTAGSPTPSSPPVATAAASMPTLAAPLGSMVAPSSGLPQSDVEVLRAANIGQLLDQDVFVAFIQNLHATNPELATELMSNPELLIQTIAQIAVPSLAGAGQQQHVRQRASQEAALSSQLSPQEMDAVKRLQELGFPRHQAIQAFLLCDKNEELAANYLFDTMEDF